MGLETVMKTEKDVNGLELGLKDGATRYKKMKDEVAMEKGRISKLQDQLAAVRTVLEVYEEDIYTAKKEKSNGGFNNIEDVIRIRKKLEEAEAGHRDQCDLLADIQQEIKQTSSKVLNMQRNLNSNRMLIFKALAEMKAVQIRVIAGELFEEFATVATVTNNNHPPFSGGRVPEYLSFITGGGSNSGRTADQLLEEVLNNGTQ